MKRRRNNEGSIYQRKSDGRWCVAYQGKVIYAVDADDAVEKLKNIRLELKKQDEKKAAISLSAHANKWLNGDLQTRIRRNTWESYQRKFKLTILPELGDLPLNELTIEAISDFYEKLRAKKKTAAFIKHTHAVLSSCLTEAVPKIIQSNPCLSIKVKKGKPKEVLLFTPEQTEKLRQVLEQSTSPAKDLIYVLWEMGGRISEVIGLKRKYVGTDYVEIKEATLWLKGGSRPGPTKTEASQRKVFLSPDAMSIINRQPDRGEYVFTTKNGTPYIYVNVYTLWHKWLKEAFGEEFTTNLHSLRHLQATQLIQAGWTIEDVKQRGGWSDMSTLIKIYAAHSTEQRQRDMAQSIKSQLLHEITTPKNNEHEEPIKQGNSSD